MTKGQLDELRFLSRQRYGHSFQAVYAYPRRHYIKLEQLGYVTLNRLGHHGLWHASITDAGRKAVKDAGKTLP